MHLEISGRQIDIGDALTSHVRAEITRVVEKYAGRPTGANVIFSRNGHAFACEAAVHLSTGLTVQAGSQNDGSIYAAFDGCATRMEKQLRRYKRRLKDYSRKRPEHVVAQDAAQYVLAREDEDAAEEPESLQPVIIAETPTEIPLLSVGEAVMQMELAGVSALVFRRHRPQAEARSPNGGWAAVDINVVYRRDDGNIGWIEPK